MPLPAPWLALNRPDAGDHSWGCNSTTSLVWRRSRLIETADGLAKVERSRATPGLDGLYIGPGDLAIAMGCPWFPANRTADEQRATATRSSGSDWRPTARASWRHVRGLGRRARGWLHVASAW